MDSPPFANQAFAGYYLGLGTTMKRDEHASSDRISSKTIHDEGVTWTRIVTSGPDGSVIEISPTVTDPSRANSISKALEKAWDGLVSVFRPRRRPSASSTPPAVCTHPTHLTGQTYDAPAAEYLLKEQLQRWMWPLEDELPRYRRAAELDPLDATYRRTEGREQDRFLDIGLDDAFLERPQYTVP